MQIYVAIINCAETKAIILIVSALNSKYVPEWAPPVSLMSCIRFPFPIFIRENIQPKFIVARGGEKTYGRENER